MKFVVLLLVFVGALAWLAVSRRQRPPDLPPVPLRPGKDDERIEAPQAMVTCAHCGVHVPQADALFDAAGHPYCGEGHRQAGPRRSG
ncbi:MAG: hypothetical protein KA711_08075 [Ideonella sp. WA131b]|jgi:uncharacterized protein|nr:hypothetical protein [Ideonella sp. WA131b]